MKQRFFQFQDFKPGCSKRSVLETKLEAENLTKI